MNLVRRKPGVKELLFVAAVTAIAAWAVERWGEALSKGYEAAVATISARTEGTVVATTSIRRPKGRREARITYQYTVDGTRYTNHRISYRDYEPDSLLAHYRPGQSVLVRYDPSNPEMSVLEPGPPDGWVISRIALIPVIFFTLLIVELKIVDRWRERREKQERLSRLRSRTSDR